MKKRSRSNTEKSPEDLDPYAKIRNLGVPKDLKNYIPYKERRLFPWQNPDYIPFTFTPVTLEVEREIENIVPVFELEDVEEEEEEEEYTHVAE